MLALVFPFAAMLINIVVAESSWDKEYVKLKPLALYCASLLVVKIL